MSPFQSFLSSLKADVFLSVLPIVGKTAAAIQANPSVPEVVAQWATLPTAVLAVVPNLEAEFIGGLAGAVNSEIQAVLAKQAPKS
jgi:hypothetical protein